jgi:hypothetical protein
MPRREDERRLNLSKKHPEACTCRDCTDSFLKKKRIKPNSLQKGKSASAESVKRHPANCQCASCSLISSIDLSSVSDRGKGGLLKRLFGKR